MFPTMSLCCYNDTEKQRTRPKTDRQTEGERKEKNRESKQGEMERSTSIIMMIIMAVVMATFSHPPLPPLPSLLLFLSQINSNALKCHSRHSKKYCKCGLIWKKNQHNTQQEKQKRSITKRIIVVWLLLTLKNNYKPVLTNEHCAGLYVSAHEREKCTGLCYGSQHEEVSCK